MYQRLIGTKKTSKYYLMKKLFTLFIAGLFAAALLAQAPPKMSYQAVVRNSSGVLVTSQSVGMKISILQGSPDGTLIYQETYNPNPQTNENGLLTLEIGEGVPLTGTFSSIDWSNGPYYLMTETDPSGGINYTISGISQLLSVPYALHANSATEFTGAITETQGLSDVIAINNAANGQIKAVSNPTESQDAATKAYVDALLDKILSLQADLGLTDIDGNAYKAIKIGNQVWMYENLKTTKLNDGTAIPLVTTSAAWGNLTTPGYCWYNNDEASNKNVYGALYNWYTINTGKLCPAGWHVPTVAEWTTLTTFLGGESVAGGKLKETGIAHWKSPNTGASNETGFTALPGGFRDFDGVFAQIYNSGCWWSATEYNT